MAQRPRTTLSNVCISGRCCYILTLVTLNATETSGFDVDGFSGLWFKMQQCTSPAKGRGSERLRLCKSRMLKSEACVLIRHKNLEQAEECPKYIISRGFRSGCQFTGTSLPLFTDVNICVNGSSPEGPLQAKFISLQIQNHSRRCVPHQMGLRFAGAVFLTLPLFVFLVKPPTTEKVDVRAGPDSLVIAWEHPVGGAPEHCLEWEVERQLQGPDGKTTRVKVSSLLWSFSTFCCNKRAPVGGGGSVAIHHRSTSCL